MSPSCGVERVKLQNTQIYILTLKTQYLYVNCVH